jgi:hypothetical protein
MSFLKKLFGFGPRNPTEKYPKRLVPPQLIWDHTNRTICGIPVPSPVEALAPLGPAEGFRAMSETLFLLSYPDLGMEVELADGRMTLFTLRISEEPGTESEKGKIYARPLLLPGSLPLDPETPLSAIQKHLGEGKRMHEDEDECIQIFESGQIRLEVAHTAEGRLIRIEGYDNLS